MPIIKNLLSIPATIANTFGTIFYTIFVALPYAIAAILAPYVALFISPFVYTYNLYVTFMNIINANLARIYAVLLTRAPWLANVAGFLQPLARFAPVFKFVQGILVLAAVPYAVAAGVGLVVAAYTAVARFFANIGLALRVYLFEDKDLATVSAQFRQYGLLGGIVKAPVDAAIESFRYAYNSTLALPVFRIMRSAWNGFDAGIAEPVDNTAVTISNNDDIVEEIGARILQAQTAVVAEARGDDLRRAVDYLGKAHSDLLNLLAVQDNYHKMDIVTKSDEGVPNERQSASAFTPAATQAFANMQQTFRAGWDDQENDQARLPEGGLVLVQDTAVQRTGTAANTALRRG